MGNLGRPGYLSTTEGMWPYSYHDGCDAGITANQSSVDGISFLPGMKLPGCTCKGEDHPNKGKARSAPEIDAVEATVGAIEDGKIVGLVSQSAQVAPFDLWYQPNYEFLELYHPEFTSMNSYRGGYFQQAISGYVSVLSLC
jgi:beta-glucanase (GH16 family)